MALTVIVATYSEDFGGSSTNDSISEPFQVQDSPAKSAVIFDALKRNGINVTDVYTSNGSEIKKAFGMDDSNIDNASTIAFVIFGYSAPDGVDKKLLLVLNTIYIALSVEPSIDGVLVMPYDPAIWNSRTSLLYTNRSHAQELAAQKLPLRVFYNELDIYLITSEVK